MRSASSRRSLPISAYEMVLPGDFDYDFSGISVSKALPSALVLEACLWPDACVAMAGRGMACSRDATRKRAAGLASAMAHAAGTLQAWTVLASTG